jgi:hypothetical protein
MQSRAAINSPQHDTCGMYVEAQNGPPHLLKDYRPQR